MKLLHSGGLTARGPTVLTKPKHHLRTKQDDRIQDRPHLHQFMVSAANSDMSRAEPKESQQELRLLEMLRHSLNLNRLNAAAIERTARARYTTG